MTAPVPPVPASPEEPTTEPGEDLTLLSVMVCGYCLRSVGQECHTPGCAFWMCDVPTVYQAQALVRSAANASTVDWS